MSLYLQKSFVCTMVYLQYVDVFMSVLSLFGAIGLSVVTFTGV